MAKRAIGTTISINGTLIGGLTSRRITWFVSWLARWKDTRLKTWLSGRKM